MNKIYHVTGRHVTTIELCECGIHTFLTILGTVLLQWLNFLSTTLQNQNVYIIVI